MRVFWSGGGGFGRAGVFFGVFLILLGVMLFIWPQLLAWTLAGLLVAVGVGLVLSGLGSDSGVRYRRLDDWDGPPAG